MKSRFNVQQDCFAIQIPPPRSTMLDTPLSSLGDTRGCSIASCMSDYLLFASFLFVFASRRSACLRACPPPFWPPSLLRSLTRKAHLNRQREFLYEENKIPPAEVKTDSHHVVLWSTLPEPARSGNGRVSTRSSHASDSLDHWPDRSPRNG